MERGVCLLGGKRTDHGAAWGALGERGMRPGIRKEMTRLLFKTRGGPAGTHPGGSRGTQKNMGQKKLPRKGTPKKNPPAFGRTQSARGGGGSAGPIHPPTLRGGGPALKRSLEMTPVNNWRDCSDP